jgi:hypothetical protein
MTTIKTRDQKLVEETKRKYPGLSRKAALEYNMETILRKEALYTYLIPERRASVWELIVNHYR